MESVWIDNPQVAPEKQEPGNYKYGGGNNGIQFVLPAPVYVKCIHDLFDIDFRTNVWSKPCF